MHRPQLARKSLAIAGFAALVLTLVICYICADTIIEVPERPVHGGGARPLPASQFADVALSFAALTENFQFETAATQFHKVKP